MPRGFIIPDLVGNGDRSGSKPIGNFMPVRTAMLRNRSPGAVDIASADAIPIDTRAGEFSHLFGPSPNPT